MPIFFGVVGIVLVICALNNTLSSEAGSGGLGDLIRKDFTGQNNFLIWAVAIGVAGAAGYIPKFKPVSYSFLALIFLSLILANQRRDGSGGLFTNFFSAVNSAGTTPGGPGNNSGGGVNSGGLAQTLSNITGNAQSLLSQGDSSNVDGSFFDPSQASI